MRIAQINMYHNGSTGKIMLNIAQMARKHGHEVKTYSAIPFRRGRKEHPIILPNHYMWGSRFENAIHYYVGSLLGTPGMLSVHGTRQLLRSLDEFQPDVLHLHNLHSFCLNLPMLFRYIKENRIRVIWTLHDCWSFTGHCPHFAMIGCDKWKNGCHHCPQFRSYPKSYVDSSKRMYRLKKEWFTGVDDMTLVSPSHWLSDLTRHSFLSDYRIEVISNGIDLSVFTPTESEFRKKYRCENKKVVLGVSFGWSSKKGLDVFIELAKRLSEDYRIVLVGTNEGVEAQLPKKIISIRRTQNQKDLADIYSAADVFVNPTREDTFPTVNMEALACGIPVITFRTGGSPEIPDESCGIVVDYNDVSGMEKAIRRVCTEAPFTQKACMERASMFDMNDKFKEYINLYEDCTYRA